MQKELIGFIGQGFVGKNYADDFERRGFLVVRYALEEPYRANQEKIQECDVVFIAVPTPTTPQGFDDSIVREAISLVGEGKIAVIKSTILPGTAKVLQDAYPDRIVLYAPEFLSVATAAHDAAHPFSNIVGLTRDDAAHTEAAVRVHTVLPRAPFSSTCDSTEAEFIKYAHNINAYTQIVTFNILYDLAQKLGASWEHIEPALRADPYIPNRYASPVHKGGRGAGGGCFIKDFAALRRQFKGLLPDDGRALAVLSAMEEKNMELLIASGKDGELLRGVYGDKTI